MKQKLMVSLSTILMALLREALSRCLGDKRRPETSSVKRILIAHKLLLGDTLLLAPLMKRIQEVYPNAEKYVLVKPAFLGLFKQQPYGFSALAFNDRSLSNLFHLRSVGNKQSGFEICWVMGDNRYSWLAKAIGARFCIGFSGDKPSWKNWMLDEQCDYEKSPATWADMAARLVDGTSPQPYRNGEWEIQLDPSQDFVDFTARLEAKRFVICHLGASTSLKLWPADRWQALLAMLSSNHGLTPVLACGPGEEELIKQVDPNGRYVQAAAKFELPEYWALVSKAVLFVTPDTGVSHIGKLAGTPTVTLFGPGSSIVHGAGIFWASPLLGSISIDPFPCRNQNTLYRRPISWVRRCGRSVDKCPTPGACMQAIDVETVIQACNVLLHGASRHHETANPN